MRFLGGVALCSIASSALRTLIPVGGEECMVIRAQPKSSVHVSFEGLPHDTSQVEATIGVIDQKLEMPKLKVLQSIPVARVGTLDLTKHMSDEGTSIFTACFKNIDKTNDVDLAFNIQADLYENLHDVATTKHTHELVAALKQLSISAKSVHHQQTFKIARQQAHRTALEKSHNRIARWRFIQAMALMAMAVGQVIYIRSMFTGKKSLL